MLPNRYRSFNALPFKGALPSCCITFDSVRPLKSPIYPNLAYGRKALKAFLYPATQWGKSSIDDGIAPLDAPTGSRSTIPSSRCARRVMKLPPYPVKITGTRHRVPAQRGLEKGACQSAGAHIIFILRRPTLSALLFSMHTYL